jgi:hypothetical protein
MNGYELAERLEDATENFTCIYNISAATKLRQLQKERDLLFTAHSHEMVRADELQIECDRLYRIVELNGKMADRVYDFDNPLLDVCKHGNDSACKECYLETVKK